VKKDCSSGPGDGGLLQGNRTFLHWKAYPVEHERRPDAKKRPWLSFLGEGEDPKRGKKKEPTKRGRGINPTGIQPCMRTGRVEVREAKGLRLLRDLVYTAVGGSEFNWISLEERGFVPYEYFSAGLLQTGKNRKALSFLQVFTEVQDCRLWLHSRVEESIEI